MSVVNQKEYLKKYLKLGKKSGKRKLKKTEKSDKIRVKIIDDDSDFNSTFIQDEDPFATNEDAPQIVAVIDERPPSMRVDEKTKNHLWQPIGSASSGNSDAKVIMGTSFKIGDKRPTDNEKSAVVFKGENDHDKLSQIKIDDDYSPPRRKKIVQDNSPLRKSRVTEDSSSSRNRIVDLSPVRRKAKNGDNSANNSPENSPPRRIKNEDSSPPRKKTVDLSPVRRKGENKKDNDKPYQRKRRWDSSPPRTRYSPESFPHRTIKNEEYSPPRKNNVRDSSPPRKSKKNDENSWRMQKTSDGKSAGLQNMRELVEESKQLREKEDKVFQEMSGQTSGRNAGTVFRDRKTGRIRNLEEEEQVKQKRREEEEKRNEKYSKWGKGVVQTESREQKIRDELHEMSKPLARYANDQDLEEYLRAQERAEDPMLVYMRKKKMKEAAKQGITFKPVFEGQFMPNRYGIRPGHRWDGVDRSNGYEKKWFDVINQKKAQQEESYKWSTEDM